MAASIGVEQLIEISKYLVIVTLCHFLSRLNAEQDITESMSALILYESDVLCYVMLCYVNCNHTV